MHCQRLRNEGILAKRIELFGPDVDELLRKQPREYLDSEVLLISGLGMGILPALLALMVHRLTDKDCTDSAHGSLV